MSKVPLPIDGETYEVSWVEGLLELGETSCQHVNTIAAVSRASA
jgi:hypothetical protein